MNRWFASLLMAMCALHVAVGARAEMTGCTGSTTPVATADERPWVQQPEELDVLANDFDPQALPFQILSVSAMSGGTPTVSADRLKVIFAPAGQATQGAFTYTIRNSAGGTATATVSLRDTAPPPASSGVSISWNCQDLECWFTSNPANGANIRAYRWIIRTSTGAIEACSRQEWTARGFSCRLGSYGTKTVEHAVLYYGGEVATLNPPAALSLANTAPEITWDIADAGLRRTATLRSVTKNDPTLDSYFVEWGDGSPRNAFASAPSFTGQSTAHTYTTPGPRTVRIIHKRGTVETAFSRPIEVFNLPPAPAFTATSPRGDETVRFAVAWWDVDEFAPKAGPGGDPTGGSNPNEPPLWEFEFGDGTSVVFKPTVNDVPYKFIDHSYPPQRGAYRARLKIVDHLGATGIQERDVIVASVSPVAEMNIVCKAMRCIADGSRSHDPDGGSIARYDWDFLGTDGTRVTASTATPTWDFVIPGANRVVEYQASLTVTDSGGLSSARAASMWGVATPEIGAPTQLYAMKPCRLLDTRQTGVPFANEAVVAVPVRGKCAVPAESDVVAAAVSVTVLSPTASGRIAVPTPAGGQVTNFVNFATTSAPRSGNAVLKLDSAGAFSLVATMFPAAGVTATTHVTVDLLGFYRSDRAGLPIVTGNITGPLRFTPRDGCTLLDTRTTPPALSATETRIAVAGECGISEGAFAAAITTTVITPAADGSVVFYPAGLGAPVATTASAKAGRNQANGGILALNQGTGAATTSLASAQVMVGTTGEFTRTTTGLRFYPLAPCRLLDTRREGTPHGRLASGDAQSFRVAGSCGVATNAQAVAVYATVLGADGNGNLRLFPTGADVQEFATVNFLANENVGNTTIVPLGAQPLDLSALLSVFGGGTGAHLILDVYGYYAP